MLRRGGGRCFPVKYRLYIDEVGNPDLGASEVPNHRYLSLTGVVFDLEYVEQRVFTRLEELKRRYFASHPDDPVILHRKELVNQRSPFEALKDPAVRDRFDTELMGLLDDLEYTVFTTVIDKLEHKQRYTVWRCDPYHYCLHVVLERYVMWLERKDGEGDVLAESRGGKEDRRLKDSFEGIWQNGTDFVEANRFQAKLTSRQLKVKAKSNNIAGLQIADLIAHPAFRAALARREARQLPLNFGGEVAQLLERSKYDRSPGGRIDGWGRKWLP